MVVFWPEVLSVKLVSACAIELKLIKLPLNWKTDRTIRINPKRNIALALKDANREVNII